MSLIGVLIAMTSVYAESGQIFIPNSIRIELENIRTSKIFVLSVDLNYDDIQESFDYIQTVDVLRTSDGIEEPNFPKLKCIGDDLKVKTTVGPVQLSVKSCFAPSGGAISLAAAVFPGSVFPPNLNGFSGFYVQGCAAGNLPTGVQGWSAARQVKEAANGWEVRLFCE